MTHDDQAQQDVSARAIEKWNETHSDWMPFTERGTAYAKHQEAVAAWVTETPYLFCPELSREEAFDLYMEANRKWIDLIHGIEDDEDEDGDEDEHGDEDEDEDGGEHGDVDEDEDGGEQ